MARRRAKEMKTARLTGDLLALMAADASRWAWIGVGASWYPCWSRQARGRPCWTGLAPCAARGQVTEAEGTGGAVGMGGMKGEDKTWWWHLNGSRHRLALPSMDVQYRSHTLTRTLYFQSKPQLPLTPQSPVWALQPLCSRRSPASRLPPCVGVFAPNDVGLQLLHPRTPAKCVNLDHAQFQIQIQSTERSGPTDQIRSEQTANTAQF